MMEAKKKFKGRRERIEVDLTGDERRVRWRIEKETEKERERGGKVQNTCPQSSPPVLLPLSSRSIP